MTADPLHHVRWIVLHISALPYGTAEGIRKFHVEERGWSDIGYHRVIENGYPQSAGHYVPHRDGRISNGRPTWQKGAGAFGFNDQALHVCMIGQDGHFTKRQFDSALDLIGRLVKCYDLTVERVIGHCEIASLDPKDAPKHARDAAAQKTCPQLDMDVFRTRLIPYV